MRIIRRTRDLLVLVAMVAILVIAGIGYGCGGGSGTSVSSGTSAPSAPQQSPKMIAYKTVEMAFDAFDFGMTTMRTLQVNKVITQAQYDGVKKEVGWPFYLAIKTADDALQAWVASPTATNYDKMNAAFQSMAGSQKSFTALVLSLQGGKK